MSTVITMPQKGLTEDSAVLSKWYVKPGDRVKAGDNLFAIEIGKAAFDVESGAEGVVLALWAQEGDTVPVMAPVCAVGQAGERAERPETPAPHQAAESDGLLSPGSVSRPASSSPEPPPAEDLFLSPRARQAAMRRGIDHRFAIPTGAEGRVIERDIEAMAETGPFLTDAARGRGEPVREGTGLGGTVTTADLAAPVPRAAENTGAGGEFTARKNSRMRLLIAKNMQESLSQMAQFTLSSEFDATGLLAYRALVKAGGADGGLSAISINDMIVYTVSRVLKDYPDLNALYGEDETRLYTHVNAGIAVDTPRGLMVPTLFRADEKSLDEISRESKELAAACREGRLPAELLSGGTFTVSSLGAMGVTSFTPVINPPQVCLLGVCALQWKLRVDESGAPHYYQAMGLSLTIDHRAVDGAPAARFLQALCRRLERFALELAK